MRSLILSRCLFLLLCTGGLETMAVRDVLDLEHLAEKATATRAATAALDSAEKAAATKAATAALELVARDEAGHPKADLKYFVFVEVFPFGSGGASASAAGAGQGVAGTHSTAGAQSTGGPQITAGPQINVPQINVGASSSNLLEVDGKAWSNSNASQSITFYHTQVLVCDRADFSERDRSELVKLLTSLWAYQSQFAEVPEQLWKHLTTDVTCEVLAFGAGGIVRRPQQFSQANAGVAGVDLSKVIKYIYGTSMMDADAVQEVITYGDCQDYWIAKNYGKLVNSQFFTSTVLHCGYGLTHTLPWYTGVSNMRGIWSCHCK